MSGYPHKAGHSMMLLVCWVCPVFGHSGLGVFWSLALPKLQEKHAPKTEFEGVPLCEVA